MSDLCCFSGFCLAAGAQAQLRGGLHVALRERSMDVLQVFSNQ